MSIIRVIYKLKFRSADMGRLEQAWTAVVNAHKKAGHASLESVLLIDRETLNQPQVMATATAISRWKTREDLDAQRTDDVDEKAYKAFRSICEVDSKEILHEVAVIKNEPVAVEQ